jgi:hypothetical protein
MNFVSYLFIFFFIYLLLYLVLKYGKSHNINLEIAPSLGNLLQNHSSNRLSDFRQETRQLLHYENMKDTNADSTRSQINNYKAGKSKDANSMNKAGKSKDTNSIYKAENSKDANLTHKARKSKDINSTHKARKSKDEGSIKSKDENSNKLSINKAGKISKENLKLFYHSISPIILPILVITQKEYDEIVDTINIEFEKNKCFNNVYRFYARKTI